MQHSISLAQAVEMTTRYRKQRNSILKPEYADRNILALSETFSKEAFEPFLNNPDCKSIRIYYGMDASLQVHAIIVGADAQGKDILPANEAASSGSADAAARNGEDPPIVEEGSRCPEDCPPPSPLNT